MAFERLKSLVGRDPASRLLRSQDIVLGNEESLTNTVGQQIAAARFEKEQLIPHRPTAGELIRSKTAAVGFALIGVGLSFLGGRNFMTNSNLDHTLNTGRWELYQAYGYLTLGGDWIGETYHEELEFNPTAARRVLDAGEEHLHQAGVTANLLDGLNLNSTNPNSATLSDARTSIQTTLSNDVAQRSSGLGLRMVIDVTEIVGGLVGTEEIVRRRLRGPKNVTK